MKKLALKVKIPRKTGRILDVGSGNNCLDIATHIVDMIPEDNRERGGDLELGPGKEFKEGSLEAIPFPDKYFDFAHAAHVLEHVEDPHAAVRELTRVASRGYIETPAAVLEQGTILQEGAEPGWDFHRWMVWCFPGGKVLHMKPKTARSMADVCPCFWGEAYRSLSAHNLLHLDPHIPYYCKMTQFAWEGSIELSVWQEDQLGRPEGDRCSCQYSAFFAWGEKYFGSLLKLQKRLKFRRRAPEMFRLYQQAVRGP
jgi:SAM-dependent methyltransferase